MSDTKSHREACKSCNGTKYHTKLLFLEHEFPEFRGGRLYTESPSQVRDKFIQERAYFISIECPFINQTESWLNAEKYIDKRYYFYKVHCDVCSFNSN